MTALPPRPGWSGGAWRRRSRPGGGSSLKLVRDSQPHSRGSLSLLWSSSLFRSAGADHMDVDLVPKVELASILEGDLRSPPQLGSGIDSVDGGLPGRPRQTYRARHHRATSLGED